MKAKQEQQNPNYITLRSKCQLRIIPTTIWQEWARTREGKSDWDPNASWKPYWHRNGKSEWE